MSKRLVILPMLLFCLTSNYAQNSDYLNYIEKYKKIAINEMDRAGIPASIKLSQAILESNAGRSELARRANNHFGIKCGPNWSGKTFEREDDEYDEFGNKVKSCFRHYKDDEDSFIAHSEFLRDPMKANRYGFLFRIDPADYRRWARGLRTSGYATGANYDTKLISIIETYELHKLDKIGSDNLPGDQPKPSDLIAGLDVQLVNDVKVVFAKNRITVQDISLLAGISLNRLEKYNERLPAPNDTLMDNERIYLQPKRCAYREKKKWHYVGKNETMFDISQAYGVKLNRLISRNRMNEGENPQPNERIKLNGIRIESSEKPRITTELSPTSTVPVLIKEDVFLDVDIVPAKPATTPGTKPSVTKPAETKPNPQPTTATFTHTVSRGDTLYGISKKYGTTVNELMRLNNMNSTLLSIGQVLKVK